MALRTFIRYLLLTPIQISIFLLISLPLACFAAVTTFFSVIFLSSRLLLVYVDLVVSVVFASPAPSKSTTASKVSRKANRLGLNTTTATSRAHPHPLVIPRSPPRSPPRSGSSGWRSQQQQQQQRSGGHYQQSFTAPSSPNIGRKRMAAFPGVGMGSYQQPVYQQSVVLPMSSSSVSSSSGSPPLSMKGGVGKTSTPFSTPNVPPPPYGYEGSSNRGKRGPVVIVGPRDEEEDDDEEDYFTGRAQ
ncbi:hypothetical protein TWF730_010937 [Orbilia blumenaviensis]|uniref:Uncharacterized protein n=1 Tax=Orbilia blumenaviensis TaxID=1796055 RepID=A0AAV9UIY3_9PEZI